MEQDRGRVGPFRESAQPPLLPIPGGRVVMLQRTTTQATKASWGVVVLVVVAPMATVLIAWAPMDVVLFVGMGIKLALSVLIMVVLGKLRVGRHTARWVIHFDDATAVLEDRRDGTALRLTRENTRNGLHPISVGSDSASLPVVVVDTRSGPLVVGPPKGTQVTTEPADRVGAADVVAPQQAAWDALRAAATQQPF